MIAFAALSTPDTVGYYAAVMTGYSILQSVTDGAAKRTATIAVASEPGLRFLRSYRFLYALLGSAAMGIVIGAVWVWGATFPEVVSFVPLLCLPPIMGATIEPLARLQRAGQWRSLSVLSAACALLALSAGIPLVLAFHNAIGSVAQLVLTEALFAIGVRYLAKRLPREDPPAESDVNFKASFWSAAGFISALQGQYQLDRVTVGALGGASSLGIFNLGWSLSRTFTDSLSTSTLNVIQSRIMDGRSKTAEQINSIVSRALPRALGMTSVVIIGVYVAARFVAPPILGADWAPMLAIVPLMSATALPALTCYCLLPVLMFYKRMHWATAPRVGGLVFSVGVGLAVLYSMELAIWVVMIRELLSMLVMFWGVRRELNVALVILPCLSTALACFGIWCADALLAALGL